MMLVTSLLLLSVAGPGQHDAHLERSATAAAAQNGVELVIYDVADLLARAHIDFEGPKLGVQPDPAPRSRPAQPMPPSSESESSDPSDPLTDGERVTRNAKLLEALVIRYITPALERPAETVAATHHGSLIANLRPEQHEWLRKFLDEQRRFDGLIQVEAHAFRVQRGALRQLGIESSALLKNETERDVFLERVDKLRPAAETINSPRLMMFANQRANIAVISQIAHVRDYTVEVVEPGLKQIVVPQIGVINEGLVLDVRPTPMPGNVIALELVFETAEVLRPITTRKVPIAAGTEHEVEISLPEIAIARITSTVLLDPGASIVLTTPGREGDLDVLLLVSATRSRPTAPETDKR